MKNQIMPLSVKLYALLPKPASVLDRKNQGKGKATASELRPTKLSEGGLCPQKRKRTRTTQRGRNLDVDFEGQKCSRSAFLATFFAREKSGKRKATHDAIVRSKHFRDRKIPALAHC